MGQSTQQRLIQLLTPRTNPYIPKTPTPKQAAFLLLDCREALYGGAAGGGKSEALLMAALQYVDVPGYAALLLRRTYADLSLPGALMDRASEWLTPTPAKWNGQDKQWTFPSGAILAFGYLEHERDKYRYQSSEFQFIGFDELTQFSSTQYTYMFSRARRKQGVSIPIRVRSGSNPGGAGHEWVKQRFLIEGRSKGRLFIPARLEDNPHVDAEEYELALSELDYVNRQRLRLGDWNINESGGLFKREWFAKTVESAPPCVAKVRYWDLAGTEPNPNNPDPDYTAGVWLGKGEDGRYYVLDVRLARSTPRNVESLIRQTAESDGRDTKIYIEQEPGSSGVALIDHYRMRVLDGYAMYGNRPTGDKVTRAQPISARVEGGDVSLVRGQWNHAFLDLVCAFPQDGVHDDPVDALSGAYAMFAQSNEVVVGSAPPVLSEYRG